MGRNSSKNSTIVIVGILALAVASCSSESTQSTHVVPTDIQAANQPFKNPVVSVHKQVMNQPFDNPEVLNKQTPKVVSQTTASLIQSTDSTKRVSLVSKGRNDPFAKIVIPYSMKVTKTAAQVKPVSQLAPLSVPKSKRKSVVVAISKKSLNEQKPNQQKYRIHKKTMTRNTAPQKMIGQGSVLQVTSTSTKVKPKPSLTRVPPKVLPQLIPNPSLAVVTPPQPELAKAVFVSGVVLIGQEPQAIIKVPLEATSQYVYAGQQLANGVLVKRIEINEGSEPVVILEQYGIEVTKMVGQESVTQTPPTATSEDNPVSLTAPPQNSVPEGDT
ncbi:hypothetical protein [Brasilonema sp. UFV-L1]|uniref:hypothetical protein n=1 Tax=Brasilonema sp. UFV-L1 TaxID=2234130 RepID=UPI00145E683E|nr:hypothetical protein [Brasilonema sp. UFV-L1]NMG10734.1 hypothetical protein [Brasilonema sp. UFV-L1]